MFARQYTPQFRPRVASGFDHGLATLLGGGPPGNPLLFINSSGVDTITLSVEVLAGLTSEQQADVATQGNSWADFDALYTWVAAQSWWLTNVMGDDEKGVAFYSSSKTNAQLIGYATWWPVALNLTQLEMLDTLEMTDDLEMIL